MHPYNLLDQRLVQQGKPLYVWVKDAIPGMDPILSLQALEERTSSLFGRWEPDAAKCIRPQTIPATEHLRLMEELAATTEPQALVELEKQLQHTLGNLIAKYSGCSVKFRDPRKLTPISEVRGLNAYAALNERTLARGFALTEKVQDWAKKAAKEFNPGRATEKGYIDLANEFAGINCDKAATDDLKDFHETYSAFMAEVRSSIPEQAVVIQTTLIASFARALKRAVREEVSASS